jgi:large subunit ribosomal protein L46
VVAYCTPESSIDSSVCNSCRRDLLRRNYASAAAAVAEPEPTSPPPPPPEALSAAQPVYQVNAGILLSRPPQVTRDLDPFEKAFFFYQKRLNERLALPFTRYFYFKRGTPAYLEWRKRLQERQTPARDIGEYNAHSKEAWNDELLVGATESEPEAQMEALIQGAVESSGDEASRELVQKPMSRVTQADKEGDQKSLNRLLQRTLYLLVNKGGNWGFPTAGLQEKESLRDVSRIFLITMQNY